MRFEWDERKNRANYRKHGVLFESATLVFSDPANLSVQDREIDGEVRWQPIGYIGGGQIVAVAHLWEELHGEEIVRIISARPVTASERRLYEEASSR